MAEAHNDTPHTNFFVHLCWLFDDFAAECFPSLVMKSHSHDITLILVANAWNCRLCTFWALISVAIPYAQQKNLLCLLLLRSSITNRHFKNLLSSRESIGLSCFLSQSSLIVCFLRDQTAFDEEAGILLFWLTEQLWSYRQHGLELLGFDIGSLFVVLPGPPVLELAAFASQISLNVGSLAEELWSEGLKLLSICWPDGWSGLSEEWWYVHRLFFGSLKTQLPFGQDHTF